MAPSQPGTLHHSSYNRVKMLINGRAAAARAAWSRQWPCRQRASLGGGQEQMAVKPLKCGLSPAWDKEQQGSTETHSPLLQCSQEKNRKSGLAPTAIALQCPQ